MRSERTIWIPRDLSSSANILEFVPVPGNQWTEQWLWWRDRRRKFDLATGATQSQAIRFCVQVLIKCGHTAFIIGPTTTDLCALCIGRHVVMKG